MIEAIRIFFLTVFLVTDVIIYLLIWNILTERGNHLTGFRTHVNNLLDFSAMIGATENPTEKKYYRLLIHSYIFCLVALVVTIITYFIKL